jgi:hypothetical protein
MKVVLNFVWGSMCYRLSLEVAFVLSYRFRISFCGGGREGGRFGNYLVFDEIKISFTLLSL